MSVYQHYARYYDLLYQDKDYAPEAAFVHQTLAERGVRPGRLLELGCGTGRHATELAKFGWQVEGVDLSSEMVAAAEKRNRAHPPELARLLAFRHGDVRSVRTGRKYDAVISLFHVMSYQTGNADLLAAFRTAAEHLEVGGFFFFDFWYGPAVLTDPPMVRVKRLQDAAITAVRLAEPELLSGENQVRVNYEILIKDRLSGQQAEIKEAHLMRYLFLPELEGFLGAAGLGLQGSGACYSACPLGVDTWYGWALASKIHQAAGSALA